MGEIVERYRLIYAIVSRGNNFERKSIGECVKESFELITFGLASR